MDVLIAKIPAGGTRVRLGTVVTVDGVRKVNVDGNILSCTWADPMVVDDGDPVNVTFTGSGILSKSHVTSRTAQQPRPRTGTVTQVPAGSPTIKVSAAGATYDAEPVGGPYSTNQMVHLDWGAGRPRVIGAVAQAAIPPPPAVLAPPPPPPAPPVKGYQTGAAIGSRTYSATLGWGGWSGDGNKVHQGDYGSGPLSGAWFYGDRFKNLVGRPCTKFQFRTGQRLGVGASGAPVTFHFYAHTNPTQPAGDTNRVLGPFEWTAQPGQGPTWIILPNDFGDTVINGGGIAIFGDPYAAMQGVTASSPESGAAILDWTY